MPSLRRFKDFSPSFVPKHRGSLLLGQIRHLIVTDPPRQILGVDISDVCLGLLKDRLSHLILNRVRIAFALLGQIINKRLVVCQRGSCRQRWHN